MSEVEKIIEELGINALESNVKIAAFAVVSDTGDLIFQTSNWDLANQTNVVLNIVKGDHSFVLSDVKYSVVEANTEGIIGTNESGMGHILFAPFQGGILVSYAMPQADASKALEFLKISAMRLNGKI